MQGLYRALYTWCTNGINFNETPSSRNGQKVFSTSGKIMGLSNESLSVIEAEVGRDIYNAGLRPYLGEACRFFCVCGASVLIHYRWLRKDETNGTEFGITKALIGAFDCHPVEYFSPYFFNGDDFFLDYPDANGQPIRSYKQLLTFNGAVIPPPFPPVAQERLFGLGDYPVMSFEYAGKYVLQENAEHIAERVRAAVCHLVKQFSLPDDSQRKGIVIRGDQEYIRYMFAAIGYAFSARAAQKIAFTMGLPPTGFTNSFSMGALVGWDGGDPASEALQSPPANLVFLENLPAADSLEYYSSITMFDDEHHSFVMNFITNSDENGMHPRLYNDYTSYHRFRNELLSFNEGKNSGPDLTDFSEKTRLYAQLSLTDYYALAMEVIKKAEPKSSGDVNELIAVFDSLEGMIPGGAAEECGATVEQLREEFRQAYIECFSGIFISILSDKYPFFNTEDSTDPKTIFDEIIERKLDCAFEIAKSLITDEAFGSYTFCFQPIAPNAPTVAEALRMQENYLAGVVFPRIDFVAYLMEWRQQPVSASSARYVCKAFNSALVQFLSAETGGKRKSDMSHVFYGNLLPSRRAQIYESVFGPFGKDENPVNSSEGFGFPVFGDCVYAPENIDPDCFWDQLQKVFQYNSGEQMEQIAAKKNSIGRRVFRTIKSMFDSQ